MRTVHQSSIYLLVRLVLVLAETDGLVACSVDRRATLPPVLHFNEVLDDRESVLVAAEPRAGAIFLLVHGRLADHDLLTADLGQVLEAHYKAIRLHHAVVVLAFCSR